MAGEKEEGRREDEVLQELVVEALVKTTELLECGRLAAECPALSSITASAAENVFVAALVRFKLQFATSS